jgi:hypothetical protein
LHNPLYWRAGGLHFTTDGTDPTEQSAVYEKPWTVASPMTLKAKMFLSSADASPVMEMKIDAHDTTPPSVKSAMAFSVSPMVFVRFSEPLEKTSAEDVKNYTFKSHGTEIESAMLGDDQKSVALKLRGHLSADAPAELAVQGVTDLSPTGNVMSAQSVSISPMSPVYSQADNKTDKVPSGADDPWTINLMLRIQKQPPNRTLIAGFGTPEDVEGHGRYFAKFANGIHFWGSRRDGDTKTPLDVKQWQMLTATYDGQTVRLYKNAEPIGQANLKFEADDPQVHIAPVDPWDKKRKMDGDVRDLTIWNSALPQETIQALWKSMPKE